MAIDLSKFIDWYKTHDVVLGKKTRTFREPSIRQLLALKWENDAHKLVEEILIKGDLDDLNKEMEKLTKEQREAFFKELLKELGLV